MIIQKEPILLSGANGFTGRFVCIELQKQNIPFIALLRPGCNSEWMIKHSILFRFGDLCDIKQLTKALTGCRALLNVASIGFGAAPSIVEACKKADVNRAVFVSTTAIFTQLNAKSKFIRKSAEVTISKSDLIWTILRPTMIYGTPDDRNIIRLLKWLDSYPFLPIFGDGKSLQQPIHVEDVAWSLIKVLDYPSTYKRSFNISGGTSLTYNDVVKLIANSLNRSICIIHLPSRFFVFILQMFESIGIFFPIKAEQIKRLNENKSFSHSEAKKTFGFDPMSFKKGIINEINLYRNRCNYWTNTAKDSIFSSGKDI